MRLEAERHRRHHGAVRVAPGGALAPRARAQVDVDEQMRPVLLDRGERDDDHLVGARGDADLRPGPAARRRCCARPSFPPKPQPRAAALRTIRTSLHRCCGAIIAAGRRRPEHAGDAPSAGAELPRKCPRRALTFASTAAMPPWSSVKFAVRGASPAGRSMPQARSFTRIIGPPVKVPSGAGIVIG